MGRLWLPLRYKKVRVLAKVLGTCSVARKTTVLDQLLGPSSFLYAAMWSSAASVVALLLPGAVDAQQWATACSSDISLDATTNIWTNLTLHPQKYYREAVENAAKAINDTALREKAEKVAEVGTFYWM